MLTRLPSPACLKRSQDPWAILPVSLAAMLQADVLMHVGAHSFSMTPEDSAREDTDATEDNAARRVLPMGMLPPMEMTSASEEAASSGEAFARQETTNPAC